MPDDYEYPCVWKTEKKLRSIPHALEVYKLDNYTYPSTEQGLTALLEKTIMEPIPKNWRPGAYLRTKAVDQWGRKIIYKLNIRDFTLESYGEDGKVGGTGCDQNLLHRHEF